MKRPTNSQYLGLMVRRVIVLVLIPALIASQTTGCSRKTLQQQTTELYNRIGTKVPEAERIAIETNGLAAIQPPQFTNHTPVSGYAEFLKAFKERTGEDWEQAASRFHSPNQELHYLLKEVSFQPPKGEESVLAGLGQLATRVTGETRQKVLAVRDTLKEVSGTLTKLQTEAGSFRDRYLPVASEIDRLCADVEKLKVITNAAAVKGSVEATLNRFVSSEALKKLDEFREKKIKDRVEKLVPEIKTGLEKLKKVWQDIEKLKKAGLNAPELEKAQEFIEDLDAKMMQAAQAMSMMAMSAKFMAESLIALGIAPHVAVFIIVVLVILALFQNGSGGGGKGGKGGGGKGTGGNSEAPSGGKGLDPEGDPKLADLKGKEGILGTERPGAKNGSGEENKDVLPQGKHFVSQISVESLPEGVAVIPYSDGTTFGFMLKHGNDKPVDLNLDPKAPAGPGANVPRVIRAISDCVTGVRNLKMLSARAEAQGESYVDLEGVEEGRPVRVLKKAGDPFASVSMVNTNP